VNHFWATVCKNGSPYAIRPLSVLSVCDVGVLWPNGWMDQDETWHARRPRPGHIVSDWDPAPLPQKGAEPPIFGPYLLWPNSLMDQDATWHGGRSRPRPQCARWGPSSPSSKRKRSPQFLAHVYYGQLAGWIKMALGSEAGLGPATLLDGDPASPKRCTAPSFRPMSIVATVAHLSNCSVLVQTRRGSRRILLNSPS